MPKEHSPAGGVKPFPIAGRYVSERERLAGMTDGERAWRAQWLKDQILSKHEPVHVPELERELMNPIRRFYRYPLDCVERMMMPVVVSFCFVLISSRWWCNKNNFATFKGPAYSAGLRYFFGKVGISVFALYATVYYFKYHQNVSWS